MKKPTKIEITILTAGVVSLVGIALSLWFRDILGILGFLIALTVTVICGVQSVMIEERDELIKRLKIGQSNVSGWDAPLGGRY